MLPIDYEYEELYRGPNWQEARTKALTRDGKQCRKPGCKETRNLEVHHRVPFRCFSDYEEANNLSNLLTLCHAHHKEAEESVSHLRRHRDYTPPKKPAGYDLRRQAANAAWGRRAEDKKINSSTRFLDEKKNLTTISQKEKFIAKAVSEINKNIQTQIFAQKRQISGILRFVFNVGLVVLALLLMYSVLWLLDCLEVPCPL